MRRCSDADAGSSVVVGFVILLALIALGIGIWALISLPDQVQEQESAHAIAMQNVFLDFKLSADKVRVNNFSGARFSMLVPGSSGAAGTTIEVRPTSGALYLRQEVGKTTSTDLGVWEDIGRLSASIGGTRGSTTIGYEAGGVFRSDDGNAVWLTPGLIQMYPDSKTNSTINVEIVMPVLLGSAASSGNWGVPVNCLYVGKKDSSKSYNDVILVISFTSGDPAQVRLWRSMFYEAEQRYLRELPTVSDFKPDDVVLESSSDAVKLTIDASGTKKVNVFIRNATYDVTLVGGA